MLIKLNYNHWWLLSEEYELNNQELSIHYDNPHHNHYNSARMQFSGADSDYIESVGHPHFHSQGES